ncbi:hypothetical protein [Polaromonas sp. CG9_12]|nr:hypothetical protein [Polaromonas sp. CG9_12]
MRSSQVDRVMAGKRSAKKSVKVGQLPAGRLTQLGPTPWRVGNPP